MTESPYRIIRLIALANGDPSPIDGHYVVDYDPSRDGVDTDGNPIGCYLLTTADPAQARQYSTTEALELWRKVDSRNPADRMESPTDLSRPTPWKSDHPRRG